MDHTKEGLTHTNIPARFILFFWRPIDSPIETLSGVFNTGHYHLASKESEILKRQTKEEHEGLELGEVKSGEEGARNPNPIRFAATLVVFSGSKLYFLFYFSSSGVYESLPPYHLLGLLFTMQINLISDSGE